MPRLAIIADNLIGANDAGVQFKRVGLSSHVIINHTDILECYSDSEIISVNTNSRKIPPLDAYERVYQTGKKLKILGFEYFYKKIDSTLRGNIAEELKAIIDSLSVRVAIISPAYPAHGRIVENGYLELIQNWGYSNVPVPICYIPSIIKSGANLPAAILTLDDIREGETALLQKITELADSGIKLIVTDAVTEKDLSITALAAVNLKIPYLAVGSAGFACSLANAWKDSSLEPLNVRQGTVIITGTLNQTTAEQIKDLANLNNIELLDIKSNLIYEDKSEEEFKRIAANAKEALSAGKIPAIVVDTLLENRDDVQALGLSTQVQRFGNLISSFLGRLAKEIVTECRLRNLIILGDATTTSVCNALKIQKIHLVKELSPGIPVGRVSDSSAEGLYLITKAGGFGEPSSLRRILKLL